MSIINVSQDVSVSIANNYLNLPVTLGISQTGYWYYYTPSSSNNSTLNAFIKPYRWAEELPLVNSAEKLTIEGTFSLITESWEGANTKYHNGSIEWIGSGVNDITNVQESDAFFFSHLGSLSASKDDAFYWDRSFLSLGGSEWDYYQYHKHLPTNYPLFENGRQNFAAGSFINPADKAYGHMISTNIKVGATNYASVLARVHTPSIGGAHNSHNDVTLPAVASRNYMPGGILKGVGDRFHAFYIAASSGDWNVFVRTYTQASQAFGAETNLGVFNLADPTFNPVATTGTQSQYPVRASCGAVSGARIYFPVIFNNATSGFDLEIWSFNSSDTIAGGSLIRYTIFSGVSARPDCVLTTLGSTLYAACSNIADGGLALYRFEDDAWTDLGDVVTNGNDKHVRVHGFKYNGEDTKFYLLLSGTSTGGANTYLGQGLYSFELDDSFEGYDHLDFNTANNEFVVKGPLTSGHVKFNQIDGTISRINTNEPAGIPQGVNILEYTLNSPAFYNKTQTTFGGSEFYYDGITLRDGRKILVGRALNDEQNPNPNFKNLGFGDMLVSIFSSDNKTAEHFAFGGEGDDYITGICECTTSSRVWITGYTKSELVPKRDMEVHGWCRNISDGGNPMEYVDICLDSEGNIYSVGNHDGGFIFVTKYDYNYEIIWQKNVNGGVSTEIAKGIILDSNDNIYIVGSTQNFGAGGTDALLVKMTKDGNIVFAKSYGSNSNETATSVTVTTKNSVEYIVMSIVSGTRTTFFITDTTGNIVEQNYVDDLVVSRVRNNVSTPNAGRFLFAGNNGSTAAKFGMAEVLPSGSSVKWINTYTDSANTSTYDIANIDSANESGANAGYVICGTNGTEGLLLKVNVNESFGTFTRTKTWAKKLANTEFYSLVTTQYDDEEKYISVVGTTNASANPFMGMNEGLITKFDSDGILLWQNVFGHDMDEKFVAVVNDITGKHTITAGWSESHSSSRDAIFFRSWKEGFGTGVYTLQDTNTSPYYYVKSELALSTVAGIFQVTNSGASSYTINGQTNPTLNLLRGFTYEFDVNASGHPFWIQTVPAPYSAGDVYNSGVTNNGAAVGKIIFTVPSDAPNTLYYACQFHSSMSGTINISDPTGSPSEQTDTGTLNTPSAPSNAASTFVANTNATTLDDGVFTASNYDGAYGPNGVFQFWFGYIDLEKLQQFLNSDTYKNNKKNKIEPNYINNFGKLYQASTVGDGSADDGNMFGYDIIVASSGKIYAIGQTSGDVEQTNTGASGVYDYFLMEFDPITEEIEFYQNGTELDEETYALCELSDGRIAFTGRTTGDLTDGGEEGDTPQSGGYDIFLGIYDPETEEFDYYNFGTGLDDKGVNIHDWEDNKLVITFTSYGTIGPENFGSEDIGVIVFDYSTDTWGPAYQTGSFTSEVVEQNGSPSALMKDGRIAVVCSSTGIFADDSITFGVQDICLAILDLNTGIWKKYQTGSGSNDLVSSVHANEERLLIAGHSEASFAEPGNAVFVEFDAHLGFNGKSAII
jgi:hypothetical protein